ncbi:MAG: hypothetical protein PHO86_05330 [Bacilli bacterium]|nr:hypothetical protein [Bacilli bacterium]MDD4804633.1 hypothetical protein [Candidatus Paceibacterota bacterium]
MNKYKYDEISYAESVYKNGFQTKYFATELKILALYFRDILNLKSKERTEKLYDFCSNRIPNYNKAKHFKIIDNVLKYASKRKNKLIVISKIDIYQGEIDYINSLNIDYNFKRVMFAFLVQIKLNRQVATIRSGNVSNNIHFKGGKQKYNLIKKMSKIPQNIKINDDIIHYLDKLEIVKSKYNGLIELTFLKNCSESGGIVISVINYENSGWYFDYYNGVDKMDLCNYCGQPFKVTSNNKKYCCNEHKIYYDPIETKTITCIDCGKEAETKAWDMKTCRCDDCQHEEDKRVKREWKRNNTLPK